MKNIFLYITFFLLIVSRVDAQQYPLYTQSVLNNFGINPAFAGTEECIDFKAGYRLQWAGFEGHPGTAFFNAHGKIKPKLLNGREWFMGVGGRIVSDDAGPFSSIRVELAWSIHVKLGKSLYGSFGIFAGILQNKFNSSSLTFGSSVPPGTPVGTPDPAIGNAQTNILAPTITPGLLIYGKDFFIGFSMQDVIPYRIPDVGFETNISTHFILKGARNFKLSRRSELIPSVILRMVKAAPVAYDINVMYALDKKYQIGIAYRNQTSVAGLLKLRLFGSFTVGYAYDYIINNLQFGTSGSHEIIIGFNSCDIGKNQAVRCAAFN